MKNKEFMFVETGELIPVIRLKEKTLIIFSDQMIEIDVTLKKRTINFYE